MIGKIRNLIQRAVVTNPGDDSGEFPITQVGYNEKVVDAEVLNPYGLSTNLPIDSICIKLSINGQEENRTVIGYRHDLRPKDLKPGEVVIGNFLVGSTVKFDEDGNITEIAQGDKSVTFDSELNITGGTVKITADVEITGDVTITGNVETTGTLENNGVDIGSTHVHSGVTTGASNTGAPV